MNVRAVLIGVAAALAVLIIAALAWLFLGQRAGQGFNAGWSGRQVSASNPALDVRFSYDSSVFDPALYDARAEYPLRLDGDGFSFYAKRIRGVGSMLDASRISGMLYDFVGSEHLDNFEQYYKLVPAGEPVYEDAQIGGKLGLHQSACYKLGTESFWPHYFPLAFGGKPAPTTGYIEGWAVFTAQDLFFFQAVSLAQLTSAQRQACQEVMDSMQFNAVLGETTPAPEAGNSAPNPAAQEQSAPAANSAAPVQGEPAPSPPPTDPAPAAGN